MMDKTILVTGGNGAIGRNLMPLLPEAIYLSRRDGDLRRADDMERIFETRRPTHVVHLAGKVGGVKDNARSNAEFLSENLLIDTNVLNACRKYGVARIVCLLSACAYPFHRNRPSTEDDLYAGRPFSGNLGMGMAKRMLETHARLIAESGGPASVIMTPATVYGPHDRFGLEDSHVVGALIYKCVRAIETGGALEVWGDGSAVRQFVYVLDVARMITRLLDSPPTESFIFAPDASVSIRTLAEKIAWLAAFSGSITFRPDEPAGISKKILKSARFRSLFPDFQFTPLEQGLRETIRWYQANKAVET